MDNTLSSVDAVFDELVGPQQTQIQDTTPDEDNGDGFDEAEDSVSDNDEQEADETEEVLPQAPEGSMKVGEFAEFLTYYVGDDGKHKFGMVLPPNVYQAANAKREPLPHVKVRHPDDGPDVKPTIYVLMPQGLDFWTERAQRLSTRGSATGVSASKRTPDELRELFVRPDTGPVAQALYAESRADLWEQRATTKRGLVEKYRRWMREAGITAAEIDELETNAKRSFAEAEQAKVDAKEGRNGEKSDSSDNSDE